MPNYAAKRFRRPGYQSKPNDGILRLLQLHAMCLLAHVDDLHQGFLGCEARLDSHLDQGQLRTWLAIERQSAGDSQRVLKPSFRRIFRL